MIRWLRFVQVDAYDPRASLAAWAALGWRPEGEQGDLLREGR